jgi:hypothetical protein
MQYQDEANQWVCTSPVVLTRPQLLAVARQTWASRRDLPGTMPPGERRDRVVRALEALQGGRVVQAVDGNKETALYTEPNRRG